MPGESLNTSSSDNTGESLADKWQNMSRHMTMREARAAGLTVDQYVNGASSSPVEEPAVEAAPIEEPETVVAETETVAEPGQPSDEIIDEANNQEASESGEEQPTEWQEDGIEDALNQSFAGNEISEENINTVPAEELEKVEDRWDNLAATEPVDFESVESTESAEPEPEPEIELSEEAKKNLSDDFANIEDWLKSGRINEEQAAHYRQEAEEKYRKQALETAAAPAVEAAPIEEQVPDNLAAELATGDPNRIVGYRHDNPSKDPVPVTIKDIKDAIEDAKANNKYINIPITVNKEAAPAETAPAAEEPVAEAAPVEETPKEAIARQKEMLEGVQIPTEEVSEIKQTETRTPEEIRRDDVADYVHLVAENYNKIGGALGEAILLGDGSEDISPVRREIWWDGLSEESKAIVSKIYAEREKMSDRWLDGDEKHLFPHGQKFANWFFEKNQWDKAA